ncbi:MAG: glucose 1-dehydrogenase [Pseudomonadota bacterium]
MSSRLAGKVAIITGGASGIGQATVELFLGHGAKLIIADIQAERGEALAAGHECAVFQQADVTREEDVQALVTGAVERFGRLDIVFNNAGVLEPDEGLEGVTADGFDRVFALHVRAAVLAAKHAAPILRAQGSGVILNTGSIAGEGVGFGPVLYSSAKAALAHFTRISAARLAKDGVRVNAIQPGVIPTAITGRMFGLDQAMAERKARRLKRAARGLQPLPVAGEARDIAEAALFLASDAGRFITGQVLTVDGGATLGSVEEASGGVFSGIAELYGLDADGA